MNENKFLVWILRSLLWLVALATAIVILLPIYTFSRKLPLESDVLLGVEADSFDWIKRHNKIETFQNGDPELIIISSAEYFDDEIMDKVKNNTIVLETVLHDVHETSIKSRQIEDLIEVKYSGYSGKTYFDLSNTALIPEALLKQYEITTGRKWSFSGEGIIISGHEHLIVLERGKDYHGSMKLSDGNQKENFAGFFEMTQGNANVSAQFNIKTTETGDEKLAKYQLSNLFPALYQVENNVYDAYYFAGDFSEFKIALPYQYDAISTVMKYKLIYDRKLDEEVYWQWYYPRISNILLDSTKQWEKSNEYVSDTNTWKEEDGLHYVSKVEARDFLVYNNGQWENKFLRGVNIGAAKPGVFPGELSITKEEYLRWFAYISEMNADVIRVYTTLAPEFYSALYEFNQNKEKPLYLLQGVWVIEEDINRLHDAYGENAHIKNMFIEDAKDLVDIFHGNANLPRRDGFASGIYTQDISEYVIGWILGIEWDPTFVETTNENNPNKTEFKGRYLFADNASPFEIFLGEVGDTLLTYEADHYKTIRPLSYTNWLTTDLLTHPNDPSEDIVAVNTEHIKANENYKQGLFASYHVYPYYPDFMNYQVDYREYVDVDGNINTYKAYLKDLIKKHTVPVIVAEFGVPASRGKAHENIYSGFNQGNLDEVRQGEIVGEMLEDIYDEGYAGALIFSWQDEWFKRTWNTLEFDLASRRPFWSNVQSNEQNFGLLAFDPGDEKSVCYVDGDLEDWQYDTPLISKDGIKLYVKSDEKYVYFMVESQEFNFDDDQLMIPIDTIQNQGNMSDNASGHSFERATDFLIKVDGANNSAILVDAYYDSFNYLHAEQEGDIENNDLYRMNNSGIFNPMYLALLRETYLPVDDVTIPFTQYETGKLKLGNANPDHEDFNSLSDFSVQDGTIEIRIPWQLLNVMDPSTKMVMGNMYENQGFMPEEVDGLYTGLAVIGPDKTPLKNIEMAYYSWDKWSIPSYHERLKASYPIIKDIFEKFNK